MYLKKMTYLYLLLLYIIILCGCAGSSYENIYKDTPQNKMGTFESEITDNNDVVEVENKGDNISEIESEDNLISLTDREVKFYEKVLVPYQINSSYIVDTKTATVYGYGEWAANCFLGPNPSKLFDNTPTRSPLLSELNLSHIVTSVHNSIGLNDSGYLYAWGKLYKSGSDGHTIIHEYEKPTLLDGPENIVQISAGIYQYLALSSDGSVWSWGQNDFGELGYNGNIDFIPQKVNQLENIVEIKAILYDSYAINDKGQLYYWGQLANMLDSSNQGDTYSTSIYEPVLFEGIEGIIDVVLLETKRYLLDEKGDVYRWDPISDSPHNIVKIEELSNITKMISGAGVLMTLDSSGKVFCLGMNYYGEVGNGRLEPQESPIELKTLPRIIEIEHKYGTSYALDEDGYIWFWGKTYDQLRSAQLVPYKLEQLWDVQTLKCLGDRILFFDSNLKLWEFGRRDGLLPEDMRLLDPWIVDIEK